MLSSVFVYINRSTRCHECSESVKPGDQGGRKHVCLSAYGAEVLLRVTVSLHARVTALLS